MLEHCFKIMIIQKIKKGENINQALKKFKIRVNKSQTLKEYRKRQEYVKPSVLKRKQKQKAIHVQQYKNLQEI